jgi:hypothetical protein
VNATKMLAPVLTLVALALTLASCAEALGTPATLAASDPKVNWAGRTRVDASAVSFDWLGVTARVQVTGASYVSVTVTSDSEHRGTRLKAYTSDQGFMLSPQVQLWAVTSFSCWLLYTLRYIAEIITFC